MCFLEEGVATHSSILAWRVHVDRGAWRATIHGVTKSWTRLSDQAQHSTSCVLFEDSFQSCKTQSVLFSFENSDVHH